MNTERRGSGDPGKKLGRRGPQKAEKIAGGGLLGQQTPPISGNEAAGRSGEAIHGCLLPGGCDALRAAPRLPGDVGGDGRTPTDPVGSGGCQSYPGFFGMGLEASAFLSDAERIEEGILIAISALERAIDRLAITKQMALDMIEDKHSTPF